MHGSEKENLKHSLKIMCEANENLMDENKYWREKYYKLLQEVNNAKIPKRETPGIRRPPETKSPS